MPRRLKKRMQQYIYKPSECGLADWPSGTLRLQGIDVTENPAEADLFTVPGALTHLFKNTAALERLPHFKGNEEKHVFFDCSDHEPLYGKPSLFIRCNTRDWYLAKDPNTISWPWPVEDYSECIGVPEGGFKYDVSFQGWEWSDARKASLKSCRENDALKCDFSAYTDFFGYLKPTDPEFHRRRAEFRRSMKESRVALCPESIPGVFPYRFFEAMSAGRVPLLVGSGYVLPFADEIPYDDFIFTLPSDKASQAGDLIRNLVLATRIDAQLVQMGRMARQYWEEFLDSRRWPELMAYAVKRKIECLTAA